jgi:two-component system, OmpR family, sensor histidine kinase MtrB
MSDRFDRSARLPFGLRMLQGRRAVGRPFVVLWHFWRRSLQFRTVALSIVLSAAALGGVGTYVSFTIGQGLFSSRLNQVLTESTRATSAAQQVFTSAAATDGDALSRARSLAIAAATQAAPGLSGYDFTTATTASTSQLQGVFKPDTVPEIVSPDLSKAVIGLTTGERWQSVSIPLADGSAHPGVMVGAGIVVPSAGQYQIYYLYDLGDVQSILDLVQRTMLLAGIALVLLIGAVTLLVVRLVVRPIHQVAEVSRELAAGDFERRVPERGEDVLATLARSFNGMADSLQRQITQLANLSRVQQRFVSDVSHELRTPLTTIRLATDVLYNQRDLFEIPTARSAEILQAQVARFESLLADLLEISRIDAHAADLAGHSTSLVAIAAETIDSLGGLADELGTEVTLVAPGGHTDVVVDARRISRIVRNLLANAIEHGEHRPIEVTVDSSESAVALAVRDHGIGLKSADVSRVFDRFWRADPSRQRRTGGTGLGLAISLEDAQLHGGTLEVWSEPGVGAHFVLTLPRTPGLPIGQPPIAVVPPDASRPPTSGASPRGRRGRTRRGERVPR